MFWDSYSSLGYGRSLIIANLRIGIPVKRSMSIIEFEEAVLLFVDASTK